ncbi:MAG: FapA family protein [Defluviitaleaceae bacterium]|nr:FapA family protein [Defluviitaleaceae bacterium]
MEKKVTIEQRSDGFYIVVNVPNPKNPITRRELIDAIEAKGLKEADYNVLSDIVKMAEPKIERKISSETLKDARGEALSVEITKDKLVAGLKFEMPDEGGALLTIEKILEKLIADGIKYGIDTEEIQRIVQMGNKKDYNVKYVIAKGLKPINGQDGRIDYSFDISGEKNQPKILGDGSVDYRQVDFFESIRGGDILAVRVHPTEGEAGIDVFGNAIAPKTGKPAPKLPKGKNTMVAENELELIAELAGQLVISGKTVSVSPVLEISGDVDFSTGNIEFEGCVNIKGNVLSGFSVEAKGNVEVKGIVEAADIIAGGAVNLYGGIMGRGKGRVESGNNVFTKFTQNATIIAKGSVKSNAILHSNVTADGAITLEGDNCFIAGGNVSAGEEIRAKTIGSHVGTATEVSVGKNSTIADRFEQLKNSYAEVREQFTRLNDSYEGIVATVDVNAMEPAKKALLVQLLQNRNLLRDRARQMEEELGELAETLRRTKSRIVVEKIMHHGVSVQIGNFKMEVNDDITTSILKAEDGRITVKALVE